MIWLELVFYLMNLYIFIDQITKAWALWSEYKTVQYFVRYYLAIPWNWFDLGTFFM